MKNNIILGVVSGLLISGCSTMHFDKGEEIKATKVTQSWHHNFVFSLFEGSSVVDPIKECSDSNWSSVKTELTFINGLSGGLVNGALTLPLWYPKTVEVSCK